MSRRFSGDFKYGAIIVSLCAFILYLKTLAPTVIWGDSAKLAIFVHDIDLSLLQGHHPLHTVLGVIFSYLPVGDYAYRQNLMSACFGALAVGLVYLILVRWTGSVIAAIGGALSLTVSHVFWLLSVINESYTLFAFLMALMIYLMTLWDETGKYHYLYLAMFTFGVSVSNNYLMPFLLPGFVYLYFTATNRSSLGKLQLPILLLAFAAGAALMLVLAAKSIMSGGNELADLLKGGPFSRFYRSPLKMFREILLFPIYLIYQFLLIGFAVGLIGAWNQFTSNRRFFSFLLLLLLADVVFASGYMRQKQFYLLIASFIVFSLWVGIGLETLYLWAESRMRKGKIVVLSVTACLILFPISFYHSMPLMTEALGIDLVGARKLPYRDNVRFFLVPDKHAEYGAERFGREVFQIMEPNSIIICDFTPITVLRYYQKIHNERKDVWLKLVDFEPLELDFVDRHINQRPIYLADNLEPDYNIAKLKTKYDLVPIGPIIKIKQKKP